MPRAPFVRRRMSLTPLVDVIFLLLLFFMLSSTFAKFGEIELNAAGAGRASPETQSQRAFIQLGTDRVILNGTPMDLDALAETIEPGQALVSLDNDTSAQLIVDLLVRLRGIDGLSVVVLE